METRQIEISETMIQCEQDNFYDIIKIINKL
jgi:hypothetical protein